MKRIVCLGGGPAGLYSAILFKKALPNAKVEVYERNRPDDTFGWGVVFSDKTMAGFRDADIPSHDAIEGGFYHWDDIDVHFKGQRIRSGGHGFCGIARKRLLEHLPGARRGARRAAVFQHEIDSAIEFADADLIVAADGVNSVRAADMRTFSNRTSTSANAASSGSAPNRNFPPSPSPSNIPSTAGFRSTPTSSARNSRTVIVETREETWKAHGLDKCTTDQSIAFCEQMFGSYLDGHRLMSNARTCADPRGSNSIECSASAGIMGMSC